MPFLRALTTVAVALSTTAAPLAMVGGADAAVKKKTAGKDTGPAYIRVVSLNTEYPLAKAKALTDIRRLVDARMGVIALQEMNGRDRRMTMKKRFVDCSTCIYDGYVPTKNTEGATPILWKTPRFRSVAAGNQRLTDAWYVGGSGAGPSTFQEKFVTWVKLRERSSGRMFYVLNTHFIPSVEGSDGYPNQRHPARLDHFRTHMSGLTRLISQFQQTGLPVFVTGDFNVNYRRDKVIQPRMFPFASLGAVGVRASFAATGEPTYGTHVLKNGRDSRLIDYVAHTVGPQVSPVRTAVLLGYNSDHRPVVGTFGLN
jgi:endonuclease/exonuclease/phosphatase family metal-dependent hydrolase